MQRKFISISKRAIGAATIALMMASMGFSAYATESGDTPAAATATGNMNAGQNNLQPTYKVSSPAPGAVAVTTSKHPAPNTMQAPTPAPQPPNQITPYPPSVPSAAPAGQH